MYTSEHILSAPRGRSGQPRLVGPPRAQGLRTRRPGGTSRARRELPSGKGTRGRSAPQRRRAGGPSAVPPPREEARRRACRSCPRLRRWPQPGPPALEPLRPGRARPRPAQPGRGACARLRSRPAELVHRRTSVCPAEIGMGEGGGSLRHGKPWLSAGQDGLPKRLLPAVCGGSYSGSLSQNGHH